MNEGTTKRPDDPELARALLAYDTATLFESAEQPGSMGPEIRPMAPGYRIAGPALTVACPPGDNLMLHAALAEARPGEVLVAQCHDAGYGVWGEILATSAMARGVVALIVDGAVRDIDSMRAKGFPVFARGTALRGAAKKRRGLLRQPISCGGQLVWPGDLVVADDRGIVVLSPAEVPATLQRAAGRMAKEETMMTALRAGATTVDLLQLGPALAKARSGG
ncbi:MAG: 4-carboxy-4-hydroxy-2-oxoadipate aldolase/oxaloacetate decarboxylase [Dongiaceae bacterium]